MTLTNTYLEARASIPCMWSLIARISYIFTSAGDQKENGKAKSPDDIGDVLQPKEKDRCGAAAPNTGLVVHLPAAEASGTKV